MSVNVLLYSSERGSSQLILSFHKDCMNILPLIDNGLSNPKGSNKLEIRARALHLENLQLASFINFSLGAI